MVDWMSHTASEWCAQGLNPAVADLRAGTSSGVTSPAGMPTCAVLGMLLGGANCVLGSVNVEFRSIQAREEF